MFTHQIVQKFKETAGDALNLCIHIKQQMWSFFNPNINTYRSMSFISLNPCSCCRGVRLRNSLSIYILGLWPKLRTRGYPRKISL